MSDRVATLHGVALSPGISKNNRRYTTQAVRRAHDRLSARLADPVGRPVVMRSFHPADESDMAVTNIAGRLTAVSMAENGDLHFDADVPDTAAGRDVAALVTPERPYLANVSIRGLLVGESKVDRDGIETIDDIEIDGLDFVTNPGVTAARILAASVAESSAGHVVITETVEETIVTLEATTPVAAVDATFADPGYRGTKRFKLSTPGDIRESWAAINSPVVAESYSPKQVARMQGKVKTAAKRAGFDVIEETALLGKEILEAYSSVCIDNGPADLRVSAYIDDPSKLQAVTQKLAVAALAALYSLDPDNDGDIDLPNGDDADGDPVCPACACLVISGSSFCPSCGQPIPVAESTTNSKEATVAESTSTTATEAATTKPEGFAGVTVHVASPHGGTPEAKTEAQAAAVTPATTETATAADATTAAAAPTLNDADHAAIAAKVAEALKPPAVTTEPTGSAATTEASGTGVISVTPEVVAEMIQKGITEGLAAAKAELADETVALFRSGGRKGVVRPIDESGAPKALHEMSEEERNTYASEAWGAVLNRPA